MGLNSELGQTVALVARPKLDRGGAETAEVAPCATAFFVEVANEALPPVKFYYAVTAAHAVRTAARSFVRVRRAEGGAYDFEIANWTFHLTEDVAVAPVPIGLLVSSNAKSMPLDFFQDVHIERPAQLGDDVYFIGLLRKMQAMAAAAVPIVRGGSIGRLYQPDIELVISREPYIPFTITSGHLIDCRAYGGISGAPCFLSYPVFVPSPSSVRLTDRQFLLGLISGHFDDSEPARVVSDEAFGYEIRSPINTGIGIVTPVEYIRETLFDDDLAASRSSSA